MIDFDKSKWNLNHSDFKRDISRNDISSGCLTTSFCVQKSTKLKCVLKKTNEPLSNTDINRNYNRAISILATNEHPAIVPFIGFYVKNNFGFFIEKEISNGSLSSVIEKISNGDEEDSLLDETHMLIIAYGISCAMEFLHAKNIIHRDIKTRHILLDSDLHPFLTGFMTSKQVDGSIPINQTLSATTPIVMAPEFIEDPATYSNSLPIDVYAYGVMLYQLITKSNDPYPNIRSFFQIFAAVSDGKRPEIPSSVPPNWKNLITRCWAQEPSKRPTFHEICDTFESEEFITSSIDLKTFDDYKKLVRPNPPHQIKAEEVSNYEEKISKQEVQIKMLSNKGEQIELIKKKSEEELKKLKSKSDSSFDPFYEFTNEEKRTDCFIGEDDLEFFKTIKKIGEGATSVVYKVIDNRNGEVLCKKVLKIQDESSAFKNVQNAYKEFEVLHNIRHPCICRAIGMNVAERVPNANDDEITTISLYLEFLSKSLKDCIDKNIVDNTLKVRIVVEIVHAMKFIHKEGMIHRDLKIENIMMNSVFESKIVDFGLVRLDEFVNGQDFVTSSMTKGVGTLSYMSPEMVNEEEYDNKTDVYSFGIVLHYLFLGKLPSYTMKEKMNGKPIPLPNEGSSMISEFCIDLIRKCTEHRAHKRPSFEEILNDIRQNNFMLAPEVDVSIVSKRDRELSFFESQNK